MLITHVFNILHFNYITCLIGMVSKITKEDILASLLISLVIPGSN
jgi:hypothetical protein